MKMYRSLALAALILVGVFSAACSASTANISAVTMSKGVQDGKAVDATNTFSPDVKVIHCLVEVANAPSDTTLKGVFTVVDAKDASGAAVKDTKIGEQTLTGVSVGDFSFTPSQTLPVGKYKVDVYLNDKLDKTVEFNVQ